LNFYCNENVFILKKLLKLKQNLKIIQIIVKDKKNMERKEVVVEGDSRMKVGGCPKSRWKMVSLL